MLIKTRGIIIKAIKYSETSIIADIYTEEKGLKTFIISGVRTKKPKVSGSLLQIMSLLDLVVYHRVNKDLARTKEIRPAYIYTSIPFDIRKSAVGTFIIEIIQKTIKQPEENKELFDFLFSTLIFLDETKESVANLHLSFLIHLTNFLGFQPEGNFSPTNSFFDMQEGVFTTSPGHEHFLKSPQSDQLYLLLKTDIEKSHELKLSKSERKTLINDVLNFYKLHIENFLEIQSHTILEAVFEG